MRIERIGELPTYDHLGLVGSQAPAPAIFEDHIKIYFSSRDRDNKSHCCSYTLDGDNLLNVLSHKEEFSPSKEPGTYYHNGFMVSQYYKEVFKNTGHFRDMLYFTGWERVDTEEVKYRTCCGQIDLKINEIPPAPFIDRTSLGVCGSSMPFREGSDYYYMAMDRWSGGESYYYIASWYRANNGYTINKKIIERHEGEGGLARPVKFIENIDGKIDHIMFSARGESSFRYDRSQTYRPYLASFNTDTGEWVRQEKPLEFKGSEDSLMVAYPYPVKIKDSWYIFYNNTFTGKIQVASMEI